MSKSLDLTWEQEMELIAEARAEAKAEAKAAVLAEAKAAVLAEAKLQEREKVAQLRLCRDNLRDVLQERFGTVAEAVLQRIEACEDLDRLKASLRQGIHVNAPEELQI